MRITLHRLHTTEEVSFPSLAFQSEPLIIADNVTFDWGELAKEVDFTLMLFYYFEQAHFVLFSGLLFVLFVKLLVVFSLLSCHLEPIF